MSSSRLPNVDDDAKLTQQVVVGLALVFEGQTSVGHVVEVLEPLEEGDGDTTSVDVQVGDDENVAVDQDLVGRGGGGAVGGFSDDLLSNEGTHRVISIMGDLFSHNSHL